MPILACVLPALTFLCQPALDALQACVGNQAQSVFTFLASRAGGLFARCWESPGVEVLELASEVVGAEETLSEIRSHLRDGSAGIVGIYGMGGVGKSTILRRIHNELLESGSRQGSFDLLIWVTVSQTVNISQIQKQIADRLGLSLSASCTDEENAGVLFKALSEKRLLVLLDDLWEALDLQLKIGIPSPKKRRRSTHSKIVLTTRSSQVCCDMDADEIVQVKPLDQDPSWELFCSKLRTKDLVRNNLTIRLLAQQVVRRCGGLPLALITVGRAMANKMLRQEWEYAVEALDHCAEQLHGMEEVLGCLKFSYDNLKNDKMRSAFLSCAMYPEDHRIWKEEIIRYWFGEGMLDDGGAAGGGIDGARNRGHVLISQLQDACLLEPGMSNPLREVRMHDAVRDMGRWLNSHEHDNVDGFLVCDRERAGNNATGADQGRERVKWIWMRGIDIDQLLEEETSDLLNYPSNRTLVLTGVQGLGPSVLEGIAGFMKTTLRVLDLSHSDVEELLDEVGLMVELRYLQLAWTRIKALPKELGNLVKLRILGLRFLKELQSIPREAMAGLSSLQFLDMRGTSYDWEAADSEGGGGGDGGGRQLSLGDLESGLHSLQELNIQLGTRRSLVRVLESDRLCRCTRILYLRKQSEDPLYGEGGSSLLQRVFDKTGSSLRALFLHGDDDSHPWVGGLRISLDQLPCLESLELWSLKKLSELVLVGIDTNHGSGMAGGWTPPFSISNTCLVYLWIRDFDGLKVMKLVGEFPCERI